MYPKLGSNCGSSRELHDSTIHVNVNTGDSIAYLEKAKGTQVHIERIRAMLLSPQPGAED